MIDIDVIGQLLPNPITMLTQLCSTLVLFLVIKKFLWKSITGMLDRRAEKMQEELTASEQCAKQKRKPTIKLSGRAARLSWSARRCRVKSTGKWSKSR